MTATGFAQVANQPYNLQIGPVTLRADAGSSLSYSDNINLAEIGRENDCIATVDGSIHGLWQATELNALTFDLGVGYSQYIFHPSNSTPLISPDSQAEFKIFAGDFVIGLQDSLSLQNNPVDVGQLSNVVQFDRFTNNANITVDWDVGDMTVGLGYSHMNFVVLEQAYSYLDYQSDTVSPEVKFNFNKTTTAGIGASVGSTRYDQNVENNSTSLSVGPFAQAQISDYLSVHAEAGWILSNYTQGGSNGDDSNINSFYGTLGITHRINDALQESLTCGRQYLPGITSNYTDQLYADYSPTWHATSLFDLAPQFSWQQLTDSAATIRQTSTIYGAGMAIGFGLTERTAITLSYNYTLKHSSLNLNSYYQNVVSLGLNYHF